MSTVAPPVRKQKPRTTGPGSGSDRPWLVVVKNDNHNTFDGVAFALARTIPGLTFEGGMRLADRIHNAGQAIVWQGQLEQAQTMAAIEEAVKALPDRQREAFMLRYWEELDVSETAKVMGCSEGSVKTHCSRATHALAKVLKAKGITL